MATHRAYSYTRLAAPVYVTIDYMITRCIATPNTYQLIIVSQCLHCKLEDYKMEISSIASASAFIIKELSRPIGWCNG